MPSREGRCDACQTFHPVDRLGKVKSHKRKLNGRKVKCAGSGQPAGRML